jgi:hypothetical protein
MPAHAAKRPGMQPTAPSASTASGPALLATRDRPLSDVGRAPSAPLVHAHDDEKRDEYLTAYRVFVINFRAGVDSLNAMARPIAELFPDWAFPLALPYKAVAPSAAA